MNSLSRSLLLLTLALPTFAQTTTPPVPQNFDVVAIHPSQPDQKSGGIKAGAGGRGYIVRNVPVMTMLNVMYRIPGRQIEGGPAWINEDRYDIDASIDEGGPYSVEELHTMFKNMLADRFGLKIHMMTKEGNIYALTIEPSGLKMKPNDSPQPKDYPIPVGGPPNHVVGTRVPIEYLCFSFGQILAADERPVVNQTGLTGNYDFTLSYLPPLPPGVTADRIPEEWRDLLNLFTAVKEQLGLRLTPKKGPVDILVIDKIDKPSAN